MFKLGLVLGAVNCFIFTGIVLKALQLKEIKRAEKIWYYLFILSGIYSTATIGIILQQMENN
jgi:hypothetical protein